MNPTPPPARQVFRAKKDPGPLLGRGTHGLEMPRGDLDSPSLVRRPACLGSNFVAATSLRSKKKPRSGECGAEGGVQAHS
jgi:hypothetical protein